LWNWLPARFSLSQPVLIFTTEEHGFRLQTLLNKIDELEHSILIIKATNGEVIIIKQHLRKKQNLSGRNICSGTGTRNDFFP
jgi:hypothetical protein